MNWQHLIYLLLIVPASSSSRGGNNNGGRKNDAAASSFSPIRELGPSLAASVAGGTIIAVRSPPLRRDDDEIIIGEEDGVDEEEEEECLVVLFRSPILSESTGPSGMKQRSYAAGGNLTVASVFGQQGDDDIIDSDSNQHQQNNDISGNHYYRGLTFLPNGPVNFPFLPSGSNNNNLRILHAPSGLLLAATGFAPDAEHILNVAAGRIFSRISVYDAPMSYGGGGVGGSKSVDPHGLVREDLSSMMIDAAMNEGGRPLGVQLLVIGQSSLSSSSRVRRKHPSLEMYTVDPSGGWRSCCGAGSTGGTAVGRGAEGVRSSLLLHLTDDSALGGEYAGWRNALDRAMMATMDALEQQEQDGDSGERDGPRATYGAVVVFGSGGSSSHNGLKGRIIRNTSSSRCAAIDPAIVDECYKRCRQILRDRRRLG